MKCLVWFRDQLAAHRAALFGVLVGLCLVLCVSRTAAAGQFIVWQQQQCRYVTTPLWQQDRYGRNVYVGTIVTRVCVPTYYKPAPIYNPPIYTTLPIPQQQAVFPRFVAHDGSWAIDSTVPFLFNR